MASIYPVPQHCATVRSSVSTCRGKKVRRYPVSGMAPTVVIKRMMGVVCPQLGMRESDMRGEPFEIHVRVCQQAADGSYVGSHPAPGSACICPDSTLQVTIGGGVVALGGTKDLSL